MKTTLILLSTMLATAAVAGPAYIEHMVETETQDTTPADGELVAVTGDGAQIAQLRYGDGETVGGLIVADPYSMKSAYYRELTRGEYAIFLSGNATVTNGTYRLITTRPCDDWTPELDNSGTLRIIPRTDTTLISGISAGQNVYGASLSVSVYPPYVNGATNVLLSAVQNQMPPYSSFPAVAAISNLTVYGWVGTHLIGSTNDCRGTMLLVADATHDDQPVNLGEHNRMLAHHRGEDWSVYAATQAVDMAWQNVWLSPYCRLTGTTRGADLAVTTAAGGTVTNAISIDYMGQACMIVGFSLDTTNVTLWVEASITMTNAPVVQWTTNSLATASWADAVTGSDWPTQTWYSADSGQRYPAWPLTAERHTDAECEFFRVMGYPTTATNAVTINLPLVPASGITLNGTNITSWAALKALLDTIP